MTTPTTETGALYLLAQIREALGDNGRRMQDELLEHCRHLAALPARVRELEARLALSEAARDHAISHLDARGDTLGHLNAL